MAASGLSTLVEFELQLLFPQWIWGSTHIVNWPYITLYADSSLSRVHNYWHLGGCEFPLNL